MSTQQTPIMTSQPLTSGRFSTTVNPLDDNGYSYSPGQASSGSQYAPGRPRRVNGENEDDERESDDPNIPSNYTPLSDTPWLLFLLLGVGYIAFITYRKYKIRAS